jgi:hypothetical protein
MKERGRQRLSPKGTMLEIVKIGRPVKEVNNISLCSETDEGSRLRPHRRCQRDLSCSEHCC